MINWTASWIWHPPTEQRENFYLHARREIRLDAVPNQVRVSVTACNQYKLYVNGQFVGRGPNPSDPSRYYYDVYDVAPMLRAGPNVIAATCHHLCDTSLGIIGQNWGPGGFLLEMRAGAGRPLVVSDGKWRVVRAPDWDPSARMNCTLYGDYKETIDTRREIAGWMEPAFDDSAWLPARVLGKPPVEPFTSLTEREIPMLAGETVHPVNAYWESASVTYAWRDDWEVYNEQRLISGAAHPAADKRPRAMKTHDDFSPSILLDFGRLVTGYPQIRIADSAGGTIDVLYGEQLHLTRVDRFCLRGGRQVLQPYSRRTFRYMKLLFPETPKPIELDEVSIENNTYPVEPRGSFRCSDDLLNRIWDVGAYTMRMSMLDHFCDCPWRERTIYGGDVYPENLIAHYAFGDPRLNRKTLRQMFALQLEDGAVLPYGPYRGCDSFYPAWSAYIGLAFIDHYQLTGDRAFRDECWPNLVRLCDWAIGQMQRNDRFILCSPEKGGKYAEWAAAAKVRYRPWEGFPFQVLLRRAGELARSISQNDHASRFAQAAEKTAAAIRQHMAESQAESHFGQYDAGLLLWSGLPDAVQGCAGVRRLFEPGVHGIDSPFHGFFMLEGMFGYGESHAAVDFIRRYWGDMIRRGATTFWEHFGLSWPRDLQPDRGLSLCHGWSAAPTYALPAHVLGVRPLEPGFAKALIAPHPADLSWASGKVPTPHGSLEVSWQRAAGQFRLQVNVPAGCSARVVLPIPDHAGVEVGPGRHEIAG
jgi:hypothetical protein